MSRYDSRMETYLPTLTVAGVLAFLAPLLSTAIYKLTWSSKAKQLTAIGVSVAVAVFSLLVTNGFTPYLPGQNLVTYIGTLVLAVIGISQLAYGLVWKNSAADAKIATITSSESERARFIEQNTIQGEIAKEEVGPVNDIIVEATPSALDAGELRVDGSISPSHLTDGPDHRI